VKVNFSSRNEALMLLRCLVRGERGIEYLQMTVNVSWKLWIDAEDVSGSERKLTREVKTGFIFPTKRPSK